MKTYNSEQKAKLNQMINEGMQVMREVEDLNAGLNDSIKAVAESMDLKPSVLKKAIRIAHKSKLGEVNQDHEETVHNLETVGKTL